MQEFRISYIKIRRDDKIYLLKIYFKIFWCSWVSILNDYRRGMIIFQNGNTIYRESIFHEAFIPTHLIADSFIFCNCWMVSGAFFFVPLQLTYQDKFAINSLVMFSITLFKKSLKWLSIHIFIEKVQRMSTLSCRVKMVLPTILCIVIGIDRTILFHVKLQCLYQLFYEYS